ncbi:MAG: TetR/AcrR family transcriptional regulator [Lachnospiraceae bacterium]
MAKSTKWVLAESLRKLLTEKSFDKITVVDIVKDSGINRQTFYYHFKDIYDLVEWIFEEENMKELKEKVGYRTWEQGYWQILNYIKENKQFVKSIYYSSGREILTRFMYDAAYSFLLNSINEQAGVFEVRKEDKEFIANFYKHGFVGLILDWIAGGMKEEPQRIVERLSILIHGDIIKALKRFQVNKKLDIEL